MPLLVDERFTTFLAGQALAHWRQAWHGAAMERNSGTASRAGGVIIAFTVIAGALVGAHFGQPSLGTVIGTAVGVAVALLLYLHDRRRA